MQTFANALLREVLNNRKNNHQDNFDEMMKFDARYWEYNTNGSVLKKVLDKKLPINPQLALSPRFRHYFSPEAFYKRVVNAFHEMVLLYDLLNDNESKNLMLKILAYRILGYKKVKLPRNTKTYWDCLEKMKSLDVGDGALKISFMDFELPLLDLSSIGYPIKLNVSSAAVAFIFMQKQYEYHGKHAICKAEKGDVVIDGGACWGDATLYFAHEVGETGKVFAFEFIPENLNILHNNIKQNSYLADRITVVKHPLWHVSDDDLYYQDHGPGSSICETLRDQPASQVCKTISIDDVVERFNLKTVNFIKMDIEGSELNALKGAEKTIKRYRPKLAISLYHKPDDFVSIPKYLADLNLDYEFYLEHHTIHIWETVLFAVPYK